MEELGRKSVEDFKLADKKPLVVVMDNIRSMHNVGSVFRTADAFLISGICLCGFTPQPPHRDIHKTALGATDSVEWEYVEDTLELVEKLKEEKIKVLAIEQAEKSTMLQDFSIIQNQKYAVIFGNEVKGVQQKVVSESDYCIEIPQLGTKHSLNISVSVGVVLWDLFKKFQFYCFSYLFCPNIC